MSTEGTEQRMALLEQEMLDLQAMHDEPLHPDLEQWVEDGAWGKMLRAPLLVYPKGEPM